MITNILSPFVILFINPEAFFLGQKIAGVPALVYAVGLFLATAIVLFCLYKKSKGYAFIALVYGMVFFINGYLNVLYYNGRFPPAIYWLILLLSLVLFGTTLLIQSGKPAGTDKKSIYTVFERKPFAGVLLSAIVLLGFLLFMSVSMMNYAYETNNYVYQIEIDPNTPLHNVTLMMPLPSGISRNITNGDLIGSSHPYITNYSQSVVETENGTMIKITADSIEKPDGGFPQDPVLLYQSFFTANPINYSYPLDHEPVLLPKFSPEPSGCTDKKFQRISMRKTPSACLVYGSTMYAIFETAPSSRTIISVSFDGERMIHTSGPPKSDGYQDSASVTVSGNAVGWYNTTGTLLAG
nr:hypothetical protein [uncultured Methanoregula sp.]